MNKVFPILILALSVQTQAQSTLDFSQAFNLAKQKSEKIIIQNIKTSIAETAVDKNRSGYMPKLSAFFGYTQIDTDQLAPATNVNPQESSRLNVTQNLYAGGQTYYKTQSSKNLLESEKSNLKMSYIDTYSDTATSYYSILQTEQDIKDMRLQLDLTNKRTKELTSRTKIGRSRQSEVLSNQSQSYLLQTQIQASELKLIQLRRKFSLLTGAATAIVLTDDVDNIVKELKPITYYKKQSAERPDLAAINLQIQSYENLYKAQKGMYWPSLDLSANYYLKDRTGALADSKWDVGVNLTIPLFEGGSTHASVSEAYLKKQQAEYEKSQFLKDTDSDIDLNYAEVQSSIEQLELLDQSLKLSEKNYFSQQKDYGLGVTSNLEVLQSLNTYLETKRNFDRLKYQLKISYLKLEALTTLNPQITK